MGSTEQHVPGVDDTDQRHIQCDRLVTICLFYHYTYYQILVVTEQWGLFAATIAGIVVESTLLKIIMSIAESTWATAMNEKTIALVNRYALLAHLRLLLH